MDKHDILSDLPSSLIDIILELLPIRDAVKTSILSRQWRYKWATIPHLVFDARCATSSEEDEPDEVKLIDFINQALLLHKGPIFKFKFQRSLMKDRHYLNQWLLFLSRNETRILILDIKDFVGMWFCVPSSLYSFQKLAFLEVFHCELPPLPPTFKGFSCLRCLVLRNVYFSCGTIESLVADSPLLEELTLHCLEQMELRFLAPNLKNLRMRSIFSMDVCLNAPNLAQLLAEGPLEFTTEHLQQQKSSVCSYGSFTNLEELIADSLFLQGLSKGMIFHHLRIVDLSLWSFDDMKNLPAVVRLISGTPNLHTLKIRSIYTTRPKSEVDSASLWESVCGPNFTFARLKIIGIEGVHDAYDEMEFIEFVLASSPVLEKMTLNPYYRLIDRPLPKMTAKLLRCRRASANAEIVLSNAS